MKSKAQFMYSMYKWKDLEKKNKTIRRYERRNEDLKTTQKKLFCVFYLLRY